MEYVHGANVREMLRAQGRVAACGQRGQAERAAAARARGRRSSRPPPRACTTRTSGSGPDGEPLGIVHRDVSPSNMLVTYDGAVKVVDFGIAKWAFQRTRTQDGTLKGKFAYMSPEQCRGRPVDRRSDIFALGAILYELTTGSAPFAGASELDILNQIATGRASPPAWPEAMGAYPPALSEIVHARAGARGRRSLPDHAGVADRARVVRARVGSRAVDGGAGAYVQELFAEELAAWQAAQREGKSLGEHLAAKPVVVASADPADRTATDAFGDREPARTAAARAACALAAIAGVRRAVRDRGRRAGEALEGRRAGGREGRRRERRNNSAVGGAGRGKESGYRTDRGKNHAVVYGDSRRGGGDAATADDHDDDGVEKREERRPG